MDSGYYDLSKFQNTTDSGLKLDNLPNDYFYSTEYEYMTLPEVQLLLTLSDSNIIYSFSGLKKTTNLHQHQLTKALKRLQDREYLNKNNLGTYELTNSGSKYTKSLISDLLRAKALNRRRKKYTSQWKKIRTIPPLDQEIMSSILERRWFGNFRFLYRRQIENYVQLCWEDSEKNRVQVNIHQDGLIDVELREIQPTNSNVNTITNWVSGELKNIDDVSIDVYDDEITTHLGESTYN
jgi:DNA-binding MarR family transcriptional regulator